MRRSSVETLSPRVWVGEGAVDGHEMRRPGTPKRFANHYDRIFLHLRFFYSMFFSFSGWGWGILLDQPLRFEFNPEVGWNPGLH